MCPCYKVLYGLYLNTKNGKTRLVCEQCCHYDLSFGVPDVSSLHEQGGGHKLEINIPQQQIHANSKGGLINEWDVMLSEYGIFSTEDRNEIC